MVNLVGSFNVAKAAAALMQHNDAGEDGERGVIINTASVAAYEGQIGQAAYSASKGGVVGMTLPMARELSRFGIRVITIAPGIFWTPMVDGMPDAGAGVAVRLDPVPVAPGQAGRIRRHGRPSSCGNRYLNGETIRLDGAVRLAAEVIPPTASATRIAMKASDIKKGNVVEHERHRLPGARHRAQLAAGPRRQRHLPLHPVLVPGGRKFDLSLRAEDELKEVELSRRQAKFSYKDGDAFVFMDDEDYTPYTLDADVVGDNAGYIVEDLEGCYVQMIDEAPVALQVPAASC